MDRVTPRQLESKVRWRSGDTKIPESHNKPNSEYNWRIIPEKAKPFATAWTGDQESYTPLKYVESARIVMGSIDLDPASNKMANDAVKAKTYYDKSDNGLESPHELETDFTKLY